MNLLEKQLWLFKKAPEFTALLAECPSDQHRQMIIDLLARTTYVSAVQYFDIIDQMREHVETVWKLTPAETLFVSSNNKHHIDSSKEVLNQLKSSAWKNSAWNRQQFHVAFSSAINAAKDGYTLVITDDFVGSGGSMLKALDWFVRESNKKNISIDLRVLTAGGCQEGISNIRSNGYTVECMLTIKKGLSDYLSGQSLSDALSQMTDLENALAKISINSFCNYRLGWGQQEAIYVRQGGNTPNNVFPIFWWRRLKHGKVRGSIMHRT
ncbi:hypothetical protein GCM10007870_29170 [Gluconobacter kondonii]|uniref:PRTase-CE domain-containing protein n=2 Tax=Gluconobacter kondonii TaxID=941463 RepID=A0ABQ5WUV7_9PROT|nr:hypothetical protein AA3266_1854 [Gluconobacter kondonii NBRC 3266]GLQ67332.1 hypothetical protein GCM10007870_29170 [Gluconobacter kondonii]